jgi:DNA-directed RNA polymerase subunit RPC12/RpoP
MGVYNDIKTGLEQAIAGDGEVLLTPEQQKNKELVERYPYLLPRNVWTGKVADDYNYEYTLYVEIPRGWEKLFMQLCEDIRQPLIDAGYLDKFRFSQVKEKYNRLECYNFGAPEAVQEIINKYSVMAGYVCTICGKPATFETNSYIASFCGDCQKEFVLHDSGEQIKFKPTFKVTRYSNGVESEKIVSFEEEWNRYLQSLEVPDNE